MFYIYLNASHYDGTLFSFCFHVLKSTLFFTWYSSGTLILHRHVSWHFLLYHSPILKPCMLLKCILMEDKKVHGSILLAHYDVIKWKHFPRYWPFVRGIHRSPVNSPHKDQWRGALMFSLISAWINGWVNNREAGDLRRHCAHYDVSVMWSLIWLSRFVNGHSVCWTMVSRAPFR